MFESLLGPTQDDLSEARIREILTWRPRRMIVGGPDWPEVIRPPRKPGDDWNISLPFCETLKNAFECGCDADTIGIRRSGVRGYTYLRDTAEAVREDLHEANAWLEIVSKYVAIRDGLCVSFALDFDRSNGDPNAVRTHVGELRSRAKPYDKPASQQTFAAADELVDLMSSFLEEMKCYDGVDSIVAMPPSSPDKPFDLPKYLAHGLATVRGLEDLSPGLATVAARPAMKDVAIEEKVGCLIESIEAVSAFNGRDVLLIDDLYQSGASANVAALKVLEAGADRVFGLFVEKTCRNDDNVH